MTAPGDDQPGHPVPEAQLTRPASTAARTRLANASTMAGPVPQTMWNRGTELP